MTDIAKLGIEVDTTPVDKATTSLNNFKKTTTDVARQSLRNTTSIKQGIDSVSQAANRTTAPMKKMADNTAKAAKQGKGFANVARGMSLQLSQVAQQGAVTGDYFRAFTIQLPDLLLGFGTLGILIGAVAGVIGGPLIEALTGSSSALDDLNDSVREGEKALEDLSDAQRELFTREQKALIQDTKDEIEDYKEGIKETKGEIDALSKINASYLMSQFEIDRLTKKHTDSLVEQIAILDLEKTKLKEQQEVLDGVSKSEQNRIDSISDINNELVEQLAVLTLTKSELLERKLIMEGATDAETKSALALQKTIEAEKEKQDLMKKAAGIGGVESQLDPNKSVIRAAERRLEIINAANAQDLSNQSKYDRLRVENAEKLSNDLVAIEKRTAQQNSQLLTASQEKSLGHTANFFGNLAGIAKEGGEEQFQRYKNLATAQAGISAALAISSVLGDATVPTALRIPLAFSIGALAAVQVAQIQGQEYQSSRASGGQAKGRVLVGENGPEVLNLGSQTGYVSPNTSVGGSAPPITNVFQISTGVSETAQAEIMRAMPYIEKVIKQTVISESRKGGAMSRAVGAR